MKIYTILTAKALILVKPQKIELEFAEIPEGTETPKVIQRAAPTTPETDPEEIPAITNRNRASAGVTPKLSR